MSRNATDRPREEHMFEESVERFRTAFDSAPGGMLLLGADGRPLCVNRAFCEMLGYTEAEILAAPLHAFTHPGDVTTQVDSVGRLLADEACVFTADQRFVHRQGHVVWGVLSVSRAQGAPGDAAKYLIAHVQDINARKRAEEALKQSEAHYRSIVDAATAFIARAEPAEGRFTFINDAYRRLLGKPLGDVIGRPFLDIVHPDDVDHVLAVFRRTLDSPALRIQFDCRVLTPDGSAWISWDGGAIADEHGVTTEIQAVGYDVTDRKEAEAALKKSETHYRTIVESAATFICRVDQEGRFLFLNEALCQKLGRRQDELIGQPVIELVHDDDRATFLAAMRRVIDVPGHRTTIEIRNRVPEGWTWITWEGCVTADQDGAAVELQAFGRDVSKRRAAEDALRTSLQELQRSEEKLRLLAQHQVAIREEERRRLGFDLHDDVCQELVGIAIMVESLRERLQPLPPGEAAGFTRIVHHLNDVVEHLRLLARDLQPMLLRDLGLEGALRVLTGGMSSRATPVRTDFRRPIPRLRREIELAAYRIAQEALTNAIRHAAARSIVLTLDVVGQVLLLEVRDDGRGLSSIDRQASKAFGLLSMEERATALGGHLEIRSEPGQGTAVRLRCPIEGDEPAASSKHA